ncbi:hypothetical protein JOD43_000477 [Pullulanibacillus pueri]|uniref:Uncharacterized protein n=1 Tax=Pullulanibacillus pueri TaxID=1437324 RepID=A0A8J2ZTT4_9BACL|nr:hypothetical protein [Pullulanibacillus pueri]MBM7680318.1 hypothetical protein [Pullulanibacillus pueri]GGH75682.1 hypothetical protein GCM10007096_05160 [Pullulanibacillus pueri]
MVNVLWLLVLLIISMGVWLVFIKKEAVPTASGAIVMAFGIFLFAALHAFHWLFKHRGVLTLELLVVWLFIALSIAKTLMDHTFKKRHVEQHSLNIFAIGTWIAGTSILGNLIARDFSDWYVLKWGLVGFNALLWIYYIFHVTRSYGYWFSTQLKKSVNGTILLPTVSTQSIVILFYDASGGHFLPLWVKTTLIGLGILFYVMSLFLLFSHYLYLHQWELLKDWSATNCIIHGAISITGLAAVTTGAIPSNLILFMWGWVLFWFSLVEGLEISRVVLRFKRLGVSKAIGKYHVSQWSRIFTFGMFYAFTSKLKLPDLIVFTHVQFFILKVLPWIVLLLLINESFLFIKENVQSPIGKKMRA